VSQVAGRKRVVGTVLSNKMAQTVVVQVTRLVRHPMYQRVMRRMKKFKVHVPGEKPQVGDEVRIEETRPVSKDKRWRLVEVVRKNAEVA
jgi:small subunit ribosomal protein S17